MFKRLVIFLINILFPPLAVMLITGLQMDMIMNCILFLCAVLPSHVHACYISWTYFSRKRKVRKGRYPGDRRWGIYSNKVQNGGASSAEVRRLKYGEQTRVSRGASLMRRISGNKEQDIPRREVQDDFEDDYSYSSSGSSYESSRPRMTRRTLSSRRASERRPQISQRRSAY